MGDVIKLIETTATLIEALSWPLVVIFLAYYFGKPLKGILVRMEEFSFKSGLTVLSSLQNSIT